jgi:hypothetical protein
MTTNGKKRVSYTCEICDYSSYNKTDYERHLMRPKHTENAQYYEKTSSKPDPNKCPSCNKLFKHRTSVYKHIIRCKPVSSQPSVINIPSTAIPDIPVIPNTITPTSILSTTIPVPTTTSEKHFCETLTKNFTDMMMMMFQQNAEFQSKMMMEMCKNGGISNSHNTTNANTINANTTTNNNTFNMNMFLNEQCKDAMNMKDFVNSIQLNLTDLENVERDGYVKGMSNILIDNLQKTDVYKRPVHCSDVKRETLYVKDDDEWARDGPNHPKMVNAVLAVEHKNVALVSEWAKANPRCMNSNTRENEKYMKLSKAATDGEKEGNIAKVIKRVAKNVAIDKDTHNGGGSALD